MDIRRIRSGLRQHLINREAVRYRVYVDSEGFPTVGVGHKVLPSDNLKVGDQIDDDRLNKFLEFDMAIAIADAIQDARELNRPVSDDFIIALAAVSFQVGVGMNKKFTSSWPALCRGDYEAAIRGFEGSLWAKQTPVRVKDFVTAIRKEFGSAPARPAEKKPVVPPAKPALKWWQRLFGAKNQTQEKRGFNE